MAKVADTYLIYQVLKRLTTPFDETEAFKLGLIDKDGKLLKKPKDRKEKDAYTYFDRFIFNLKRILHKFGLKSKFSSYAAALFLLKEERKEIPSDIEMYQGILEEEKYLRNNYNKNLQMMREDAPTMSTGAAVAGTGDDPVHWRGKGVRAGFKGRKNKVGRSISALNFIKMRNKMMANNSIKTEETNESLWANIHKKRREGRPMRKKGEKGAPTVAQMKRAQAASEEAPTIGGIKMKKLGKSKPGGYKSLVTRHLGSKAAEKIDKSDGSKLVAKGKKTGNTDLIRKGNFIKNVIGRK